jgi:hypothetical protein
MPVYDLFRAGGGTGAVCVTGLLLVDISPFPLPVLCLLHQRKSKRKVIMSEFTVSDTLRGRSRHPVCEKGKQ